MEQCFQIQTFLLRFYAVNISKEYKTLFKNLANILKSCICKVFNTNTVVTLAKKVEYNKCPVFIFVYILSCAECVCTHKKYLNKVQVTTCDKVYRCFTSYTPFYEAQHNNLSCIKQENA